MGKRLSYVLIFFAVTALLWYAERVVTPSDVPDSASDTDPWMKYHEFSDDYLPTSTTGVIVHHDFYSLSYSQAHEQAEWLAYELVDGQVKPNNYNRPYFKLDKRVPGLSAHWRNYKNSGFDRGHLCPAADRSFSYKAFEETFLTSNISPQDRAFNAGIWNRLEHKIRFWVKGRGALLVVTGGILEPDLRTVGPERVSVPDFFYKIVLDHVGDNYKMIAFIIPHEPSDKPLLDYVVSVDEIEERTGIDFFGILPDPLEDRLEANRDLRKW